MEIGNKGRALYSGFFYNEENASITCTSKRKWLRNFEMMRLSLESKHKFSGGRKSKLGPSKK